MRQKPGSESIRRVDAIEMIESAPDQRCDKPGANQLGEQDLRQTLETVSGKQLAADFDAGIAQFVDPPYKRRMRYAKIPRELLSGNSNHCVLHQRIQKLVQFSIHELFGRDPQVYIRGANGMCQRTGGDVIDA